MRFARRQNVIRAGLRNIALAYTRISLSAAAAKLALDNPSDMESIAAKASYISQLSKFHGIELPFNFVVTELSEMSSYTQAIRDGVINAFVNE